MIPFQDTVPRRHTPWLTWTLIGVNFAVFFYTLTLSERAIYDLFYHFGLVPARYTQPNWATWQGLSPHDYRPFLTNMFLHGGWLHIILNMWMLWIFGDNIEDRMGPWRFLAFYLLCGLFADLIHLFTNSNVPIPTIGASGAIAGVMGAYFFLYPYARIVIWIPIFFLPLFVEVPAIAFLGLWVIIQLYRATTAMVSPQGYADVAWWGHLGGFLAGMLLFRLFLTKEDAAQTDEKTSQDGNQPPQDKDQ